MLSIKKSYPNLHVATAFFDVGGDNVTELFRKEKDTFAVSQLPYFQTALPVFYMYLRVSLNQGIPIN
jgi:hypothetical protein